MTFKPMPLPPLPEKPLVSVIMSNYNYEQYIEPAIRSMLAQTYSNWELVVCDDGSTDGSRQVLERLTAEDSRIRAIYKENGGQASAWDAAFARCRGEIIGYLDSDDLFRPDKLERVVRAFQNQPDAGLLCHPLQPVSSSGEPIGEPVPGVIDSGWRADIALDTGGWGRWPPTTGICIRREVAERIFPMPTAPSFRRGGADSYTASAAQFLTKAIALEEPIAEYRIHGSNWVGFSRPSVSTLAKLAEDVKAITEAIAAFVAREFGQDVATRIHIVNVRQYWECVLGLYVLEGKPKGGIHGFTAQQMMANLPPSPRNRIWRVLLSLPAGASKKLLPLWWGTAPWKRYLRPVAGRLGVR